jgi:predicted HAD superfamily hydrolase
MTEMDLLFGVVFGALFIGSLIYLNWLFKRLRHGEDLPDR